jgi:ribosomal protein S18 acetylase RimI-like enzyme
MGEARATVRTATKRDFDAMSASLARAFYDDPVFSFLLPDDSTRLKKLETVLGIFIKTCLPHHTCYTTDNYESVTLWRPPGGWHTPVMAYITNGPALLSAFGGGVFRSLAIVDMMEKIHPKEPHWYLQTIGTDPKFQGKGYGGIIMRDRLAAVDALHLPCYLESSKSTNIPIYQSFGFELTGEIAVPNGGPKIWPMWRNAR